jgi:serine/threonine-protein kinase
MNWPKAVAITLGVLVATFGIGYLVATRMLFPPLPAPENGIVVPDLGGTHVSQVNKTLSPLGLRLASGEVRVAHPSQPPGIVVAQDPLPGQQLRAGGVVRVAVSGGLPRVQVPDVVGFDVERATAVLLQLGLSADQVAQESERPIGTVLSIRPEPGQRQPVPARVLLVVSAGPPPAPPVDSTQRTLPDSTAPARPDSTAPPDTLAFRANN